MCISHIKVIMFNRKDLCTTISEDDNFINTRLNSGPLFPVLKPNCESYKRSICYSGAVEWNSLSLESRNLEDFFVFKGIKKNWLLNTYIVNEFNII